LTGNSLF